MVVEMIESRPRFNRDEVQYAFKKRVHCGPSLFWVEFFICMYTFISFSHLKMNVLIGF